MVSDHSLKGQEQLDVSRWLIIATMGTGRLGQGRLARPLCDSLWHQRFEAGRLPRALSGDKPYRRLHDQAVPVAGPVPAQGGTAFRWVR
jgi:hypothetical protein